MKLVVLLLVALTGCHALSLRQLLQGGACVELCSSDADCSPGQHCGSNGCGHSCQAGAHLFPNHCPQVLCALYCENGFARGADGCPTCSCNTNKCSPVMCEIACPAGMMATDANGCPICACNWGGIGK